MPSGRNPEQLHTGTARPPILKVELFQHRCQSFKTSNPITLRFAYTRRQSPGNPKNRKETEKGKKTMSREAYQVPSLGAQNAFGTDGLAGASIDAPIVAYICGECNARVSLKRGDQIRCKECGHRVLYKERTKRMVQFEAR